MKATFNQHIGVFEKALPEENCDFLINFFNSNQQYSKDRHTEAKELYGLSLPYGVKEDRHIFLENLDTKLYENVTSFLLEEIAPLYLKKYIKIEEYNGFSITSAKIQKTLPSEGYHIWHNEISYISPKTLERVLAYTIYLNDVEEGGETEFLHQSLRVKSTKGTVCIFPAHFTHSHRGNPPLSGEKYIVTGWIETPIIKG